ncbi:MAG: hypothetical protein LRY32_01435, partial [Flavobacterium sp.]|nr:hypothetical protein [Flavobacterium sp.]
TIGTYYMSLNSQPGYIVRNNHIQNVAARVAARYLNVTAQSQIDANNYVNGGGTALIWYNATNNLDLAGYKTAGAINNHGKLAQSIPVTYINNITLEPDSTKAAPSGPYAGADFDFLNKRRCTIFATSGAYESSFGKAAPKAQFFGPNPAILGSPVVYRNVAKDNEPKVSIVLFGAVKSRLA